MKNSRLLTLLEVLAPGKWTEAGDFLRSPYFNRRSEVVRFFDYLEEQLLHLSVIPSKEEASIRLYPGEAYDPQRIRQLMSYLVQALEEFLALEQWRGNRADRDLALAAAYRELGLAKHFRQTLRRTGRELEKRPYRQAGYYERRYRLEWEAYQFSSREKRTGEQNLQGVSDHLDRAFIIRKLRQSCLLLAHRAVFPTTYDFGLLPAVLSYVEEQSLLDLPAVAVYYHASQALAFPEREDYFPPLQRHLLAYSDLFPAGERRDLFLLAVNYCIRKLNEGNEAYAAAGLQLYRAGLLRGDLLTDGAISRFAYRNIVAMGLKVGDLEATEQFIHEYRSHLPPEHRESMYSFSRARLAYRRGAHGEAVAFLQKAEYEDLLLNLAAKTLLMKIYYETGAHDLLASHLEAMRNFLRRKRVLGYHRTNYRNVIRFTQKLLRVNPFDKAETAALRKEIEAEEVLTEREWLLARMVSL